MIPNKSSLFNKIPYLTYFLVENKNKIPTFLVENKISPKIVLLLLKKCVFGPDPDFGKIPGSVKN